MLAAQHSGERTRPRVLCQSGSDFSAPSPKIIKLSTQIPFERLAELVELSPFHFSRVFKQTTGMSRLQFVVRETITACAIPESFQGKAGTPAPAISRRSRLQL